MITCKLGEKKYQVDFVSARVMREIGPAEEMRGRIMQITENAMKGETSPEDAKVKIGEAMDVLVDWFCILFGRQFTVEEVYDNYPVDSLMHDITVAMLAVQNQMTAVLSEFPMKPAAGKAQTA